MPTVQVKALSICIPASWPVNGENTASPATPLLPTFVYTPINAFQLDDPVFYKTLTERIPLGRIGKEQDIASAALYLCSDAASL